MLLPELLHIATNLPKDSGYIRTLLFSFWNLAIRLEDRKCEPEFAIHILVFLAIDKEESILIKLLILRILLTTTQQALQLTTTPLI